MLVHFRRIWARVMEFSEITELGAVFNYGTLAGWIDGAPAV